MTRLITLIVAAVAALTLTLVPPFAGTASADSISPDREMHVIAKRAAVDYGLSAYGSVSEDFIVLDFGVVQLDGDGWLEPGQTLDDGFWFFPEGSQLLDVTTGELVTIELDSVLYLADWTTKCSVTCGKGYFACCRSNGKRCWCVENGTDTPRECDSGGPGATSCEAEETLPVGPRPKEKVQPGVMWEFNGVPWLIR